MRNQKLTNRREFLRIAVLGAASAGVLAACAPAATPTAAPAAKPAEPTKAAAQPTQAAAAAKPTEAAKAAEPAKPAAAGQKIQVDAWFGALGSGAQTPARELMEKTFNEENPDLLLKTTSFPGGWGEMWEKTLTAMAAGTVAPAIALAVFDTGMYAERNGIRDLSSYMKADPAYARDKFLSACTKSTVYNGKDYALPWNLSGITFNRNLTLSEAAGFKGAPKTWDEVTERAIKLTDESKQQYGYFFNYKVEAATTSNVFGPILMSFGANWFDNDDGALLTKAAFNTEQGVAAIDWALNLIKKKGAIPPGMSIPSATANGKIGMWSDGQWQISNFLKDAPNLKWEPSLLPDSKYGKGMTVTGGNHWGITTAAKQPDAAWRWLKFITSEKWDYEYASRAGYLPAHESGYDKKPYTEMPWKVFGEQARFQSRVRPAIPEINECFMAMATEIEAACFGRQTAAEAMKKAEAKVNDILAKKRAKK